MMQTLGAWWHEVRERLPRLVAGADYFISYSRIDGRAWAQGLAVALGRARPRYTHAADFTHRVPFPTIPASLQARIRQSTVFVLIATPGACRPAAPDEPSSIAQEVRLFKATGRPIHVVRFPGADPSCADWADDLRGLPPDTGEGWTEPDAPPAELLQALALPREYLRQARRQALTTSAVVGVALVAGVAALLAVIGRNAAIEERDAAHESRKVAEGDRDGAIKRRKAAEQQAAKAIQQRDGAIETQKAAEQQASAAERKSRRKSTARPAWRSNLRHGSWPCGRPRRAHTDWTGRSASRRTP